jgi:glycosyltransferase involved in cell wall biosynthesis
LKILILSQWFQPEPVFKGLPLAKALRDRGHEVEVLTGFPNYPGGRIYPGYRIRPWQREIMDDIRVNRVALYPSHDKSGLRRAMNYLSFGLSAAMIGNFLIKRPDIIYALNLVTLGLTTNLLRLRFRCPVIYDILDLWPDSVADSRMLDVPFLLKVLDRWSKYTYKSATHLITVTPGMKYELLKRGIDKSRISVVYNWCDEEHMKPTPRDEYFASKLGLRGYFVVMFAGTMGVMQKLEVLLDTAERLKKTESRIKFVLVGGGVECSRLKQIAVDRQLSNVIFLEKQPAENMGKILALADVTVVHLKDSPLFRITIPSKIQAYMAAGKPIIAGIRGDAASLLSASGAGKVVAPENPEAIAEGVVELYRMSESERNEMGQKGRKYYKSKMSIEAGVNTIEDIFINCTKNRRKIVADPV